mmetsp:Transcript_118801/g.253530  ORF Transcript_118801/g.253530 Transcript_118801/m.253530 type:complete len:380 (+) Transcript_118801:792-1931(+)
MWDRQPRGSSFDQRRYLEQHRAHPVRAVKASSNSRGVEVQQEPGRAAGSGAAGSVAAGPGSAGDDACTGQRRCLYDAHGQRQTGHADAGGDAQWVRAVDCCCRVTKLQCRLLMATDWHLQCQWTAAAAAPAGFGHAGRYDDSHVPAPRAGLSGGGATASSSSAATATAAAVCSAAAATATAAAASSAGSSAAAAAASAAAAAAAALTADAGAGTRVPAAVNGLSTSGAVAADIAATRAALRSADATAAPAAEGSRVVTHLEAEVEQQGAHRPRRGEAGAREQHRDQPKQRARGHTRQGRQQQAEEQSLQRQHAEGPHELGRAPLGGGPATDADSGPLQEARRAAEQQRSGNSTGSLAAAHEGSSRSLSHSGSAGDPDEV